jgi:hypothetical protein
MVLETVNAIESPDKTIGVMDTAFSAGAPCTDSRSWGLPLFFSSCAISFLSWKISFAAAKKATVSPRISRILSAVCSA